MRIVSFMNWVIVLGKEEEERKKRKPWVKSKLFCSLNCFQSHQHFCDSFPITYT